MTNWLLSDMTKEMIMVYVFAAELYINKIIYQQFVFQANEYL